MITQAESGKGIARKRMFTLSTKDKSEIYYALESKLIRVEDGAYGSENFSRAWVKHLKAIIKKVGPDGCNISSDLLE